VRGLKPLAFAVLCLIWGSTWLAIKEGYGGLGPFNVAALRFAIAGVLMLALVPVLGARLPRSRQEWMLSLFVGAVLFAMDYGLIYWGEQYLDSGLTAVVFAVMPIMTALIAHAYLPAERLTARKMGGAVVAVLGVATLFGASLRVDAARVWPMLAIVGAALGGSLGTVATKRHGKDLHPAALNAPAMLFGALLLALASLATGDGLALPTDATTWTAVLYLALAGSIVTFLIYFWLLKSWDSTTMSFISVFTPALALLLGFLVRGERPTALSGVGAALILAGVWLATRKPRAHAAPALPDAAPSERS
jgi:drug/metabolite transporter (DMT)-like permease